MNFERNIEKAKLKQREGVYCKKVNQKLERIF